MKLTNYLYVFLMLLSCIHIATAQKGKTKSNTTAAPKKELITYMELRFQVEDSVQRAKGFDSIFYKLRPRLTYVFRNEKWQEVRTLKFYMDFDPKKQCWTANKLPYGIYELELYDLAFRPVFRQLFLNKDTFQWEQPLPVDTLPYTYQNGKRYQYTRGTMNFAQTFIVYFNDGDPIKNKKTIEKVIPEAERIHKMKHHNGFYITIPVPDRTVPISEMFYEQRTGNKRKFEGFYLGDAITSCIMRLQALPNVQYANPTFYNDVREAEMYDVEKVSKSNYLKRKELGLLSEDNAE